MNNVNDNRCRISDRDLMNLIDPQGTILANLAAIKSKGYKISKDRIAKFLKKDKEIDNKEIKDKEIDNKEIKDKEIKDKEIKDKEIKDKEIDNTMDYNNDLEDAFEALNNNRLHIVCTSQNSSTNKKLTRKEFNNTINKMIKDIKTTCVNEFDAFDTKKEELLNWAKHNFYKVTDKDRTFEELMSGLRLHLSRIRQLSILGLKLEKAKNDQEFVAIESQMYKIIDSFNNPEKSKNARVKLREYKLEWELEHNSPF